MSSPPWRFRLDNFTIELGLAAIEALHPHEATIPHEVLRLKEAISDDGLLKDPLIVDASTNVVLDGMHRLAALKALGVDRAVVCMVDYFAEGLEVKRWVRWVAGAQQALVEGALKSLGLEPVSSPDEALLQVDGGRAALALLTRAKGYVTNQPREPVEDAYQLVAAYDRLLQAHGLVPSYLSEREGLRALQSRGGLLLYPLSLRREEVLDLALAGRLLPPKCTRHIIPVRPLRLDYPLDHLYASTTSYQLAEEALRELARRPYRLTKPGAKYGGRVYEERLIIFQARR